MRPGRAAARAVSYTSGTKACSRSPVSPPALREQSPVQQRPSAPAPRPIIRPEEVQPSRLVHDEASEDGSTSADVPHPPTPSSRTSSDTDQGGKPMKRKLILLGTSIATLGAATTVAVSASSTPAPPKSLHLVALRGSAQVSTITELYGKAALWAFDPKKGRYRSVRNFRPTPADTV